MAATSSPVSAIQRNHEEAAAVIAVLRPWLTQLPQRSISQSSTGADGGKLLFEPIFEADLPREQHGYRPERNALSAVKRDEKRGIPKGSSLSPLMSNNHMRRFILGWMHRGYERRLGAHIVSSTVQPSGRTWQHIEQSVRASRRQT